MKKLFLLQFLIWALPAISQNPANTSQDLYYKKLRGHAFGAILTSSNGKGLTYRYWPGKNGFHASIFPSSSRTGHFYSVALTAYRNLYELDNSRLFLHCGLESVNVGDIERSYAFDSLGRAVRIASTIKSRKNALSVCIGPGFEFIQRNIAFDVYLGVQGRLVRSNYENIGRWESVPDGFFMNISGGVAMFYLF